MPLSKRRKNKKGKPVQRDHESRPSGLTLQDLINVVAYQESQKAKAAENNEEQN